MADSPDIKGILESISKASASTKDLKALSDQLKELQKSAKGLKEVSEIQKYNNAVKQLIKTQEQQVALEQELAEKQAKGQEVTEHFIKVVDANAKAHQKAAKVITAAQEQIIGAHEKTRAELKEQFLQTTLLGKAYQGLTGPLAKFTAGLGVGALAMKAFSRFADAAKLRSDLMIQSFQGLDQMSLADAAAQTVKFDNAIREAESTALRLGMKVEDVGPIMTKFARIVGDKNPAALSTLTQASMSVAKTLNLDVAEAADYVSERINKFGGSTASALLELNAMSKGVVNINKQFKATVIRGDDLARTILEISRNTSIYALDQRFISGVMQDNITRLQSMGASYDEAFKKAKNFSEGLTTKAPEWMKILSGEDIFQDIGKSVVGKGKDGIVILSKEMTEALDKAKPGLAKKVASVYSDPKLSPYDKSRIIQEITAGTSIGAKAMNDQILKLADQSGSGAATTIKNAFGVSYEEANAMIESARAFQKDQAALSELDKTKNLQGIDKQAEAIKKIFNANFENAKISDEEAKYLANNRGEMEKAWEIKKRENDATKYGTTLATDAAGKLEQQKKLQQELLEVQKKRATATKGSLMEKTLAAQEDDLKVKIAGLDPNKTLGENLTPGQQAQIDQLKEVVGETKLGTKNTAVLTGNEMKAMFNDIASIKNIMIAMVAKGAFDIGKSLITGKSGIGELLNLANTSKIGGAVNAMGSASGLSSAGGLAATAGSAAAVAGAAYVGYQVGTVINDAIDEATGGVGLGGKLYDWMHDSKEEEVAAEAKAKAAYLNSPAHRAALLRSDTSALNTTPPGPLPATPGAQAAAGAVSAAPALGASGGAQSGGAAASVNAANASASGSPSLNGTMTPHPDGGISIKISGNDAMNALGNVMANIKKNAPRAQ